MLKIGSRKLAITLIILGVLFLLLGSLLLTLGSQLGGSPSGDRLLKMNASQNFKAGQAQNLLPTDNTFGIVKILETMKDYRSSKNTVPDQPPVIVDLTGLEFAKKPASGLRVTWLGHSTVLVEIDGKVILFDPVFAERASMFAFLGPQRFHPVPINIEDLPDLDAVIISHDHYDHLDQQAIKALAVKTSAFYVPLGVGAHLEKWAIADDQIVELDWWDETIIGELKLVASPARHFSGRSIYRDNTLWASWVAVGPKHKIFFSGDTGFADFFEQVGERYGPFDITFIKVGAYGRNWPDIHIGPDEALVIHRLVRGNLMMPIHWGTFSLSYHAWTEPAERLIAASESSAVRIVIPKVGQLFEPTAPPPVERWWQKLGP